MAQHIHANARKIIRKVSLYIKEQLGISSLYDSVIWKLAFFISIKSRQTDFSEEEKIDRSTRVTTDYNGLFNNNEKYLIINLLSIVHQRKVDINNEEVPKLIEQHCRHGFKILEEKFTGTQVDVIQFFLNEIPDLGTSTPTEDIGNLEDLIVKNKDNLSEKLYEAFIETKIAVKYLGYRDFQRISKYYFEVRDLNHNREIVDEITKSNLELQTGLHNKLYLANSSRERTFSVNVMKDDIPAFYMEEYLFETNDRDYSLMVGLDDEDRVFTTELTDLPHLLIGGTTGSGKSVFLKSLVHQLSKKYLNLVLIDPKGGSTFGDYADKKHCVLVNSAKDADAMIGDLIEEMEQRYHGKTFNNVMPLVLVIDELADLLSQHKGIAPQLIRLAQKGREARIHLILATQRPDAKILEGLLRSNLPSRVAFKVQNQTESRIILGTTGAEHLQSKGEMLFNNQKFIKRLQGFFIE